MSPSNTRVSVLVLAALMVVGGIGTWITGFGQSVNGFDRDGAVVIACGAIIALGVLLPRRATAIVAVIVAVISTAISVYDWQDVQGTSGLTVGWGLWLSMIASALAIVATIALLRARSGVTEPA